MVSLGVCVSTLTRVSVASIMMAFLVWVIAVLAYRFGGQRVCDNKQLRTDLLEEAVWQDVCLLLTDPQRVEKEYKRRLTGRKKHVGWNTTEQLHALIKKVKRGMARFE